MATREDVTFAAALERRIFDVLHGNTKNAGIIRTGLNGADFAAVRFDAGRVVALEAVLDMMHEIAREMNDERPVRDEQRTN